LENMNKFLLFILLFFVAAGGLGFWYWQTNVYSKEVLKLEILGPEVIQAGDEVEYIVKYKNNGKVRLEVAELTFEYPKTAIPSDSQLQRIIKPVDDIYPGEERTTSFKARIFGKQGDNIEAKASLTYKPKSLKAQYESKTSFSRQIQFVPLTFEFDMPLQGGQSDNFVFSINYFSNINYPLENLRVKVDYPGGFKFLSSKPKTLDEKEWSLPILTQANGGRIEITGALDGGEGAQKVFKAQLGILKDNEFIALKEVSQAIGIAAPSIYISEMINGSQSYSANLGDTLHYEIYFKNIGKQAVEKKFLFAKLEGDFFDMATLKSNTGEVGRGDNSVVWDWKAVPTLRFLDADEEGKVDFWVNVKSSFGDNKNASPILKTKITFGEIEKVFETKINSQVELAQKVYYQDEVFGNSGPNPAQVGQKTTYTVVWQVKNYWNQLNNVKVKTKLPDNVEVTGKLFPEDAKFTFDSQSKEIIWNVGDVATFQGVDSTSAASMAFQIGFMPSLQSDIERGNLMNEVELLGQDNSTSDIIDIKVDAKGVSQLDN